MAVDINSAIGTRVRVSMRQAGDFAQTAVISAPPENGRIVVRFDTGSRREYMGAPGEFDYDIADVAGQRFAELVAAHVNDPALAFLQADLQRLNNLTPQEWATLGVELTPAQVQAAWQASHSIQLRRTDSAAVRDLVVGCGNNLTPDELMEDGHDHAGAYTTDPNIALRPTVVGLFGYEPVAQAFPAAHFDRIMFEGYAPVTTQGDLARQPHFLPDLLTLLRDQGQAAFSAGPHEARTALVIRKAAGQLTIVSPPDRAGLLDAAALRALLPPG